MISREQLENHQVILYAFVILIAGGIGVFFPNFGQHFEMMISFIIAVLMYSMFSQIPFTSLKESFTNRRFISALCIVNYLAVPIVVWLLTYLLPDHPVLLLGVYLVLLTPCIDYVIVFTALGRGNERAMLMATPILFITQMLLLPIYLWIFIGREAIDIVEIGPFIEAFISLIVIPLIIAIVVQLFAEKNKAGENMIQFSAWLPVPFMALTLFVVIVSQIGKLTSSLELILKVVPIYILFMLIMPWISKLIGKVLGLDIGTGRALIFSGSTRNSLVVLPLALSLPNDIGTLVAAVIVTQTIVEIIGEVIYIKIVPNVILRG